MLGLGLDEVFHVVQHTEGFKDKHISVNAYLTRLHSSDCLTQSESDQNYFLPEVLKQ